MHTTSNLNIGKAVVTAYTPYTVNIITISKVGCPIFGYLNCDSVNNCLVAKVDFSGKQRRKKSHRRWLTDWPNYKVQRMMFSIFHSLKSRENEIWRKCLENGKKLYNKLLFILPPRKKNCSVHFNWFVVRTHVVDTWHFRFSLSLAVLCAAGSMGPNKLYLTH